MNLFFFLVKKKTQKMIITVVLHQFMIYQLLLYMNFIIYDLLCCGYFHARYILYFFFHYLFASLFLTLIHINACFFSRIYCMRVSHCISFSICICVTIFSFELLWVVYTIVISFDCPQWISCLFSEQKKV